MVDLKTKTCLVCDFGLFVELAVTLSKSFGKTYYYSPWEKQFPTSNDRTVGKGIPGVERINKLWDVKKEVDLFVFPDVYYGDMQLDLQEQGFRVWGSRDGDELELFRDDSKKHLKKLGIPIGNYELVKGIEDLRKYLKEHKDVYVKVSLTRGDCETFYSANYKLIEPRLDEIEANVGVKKYFMEFIVEDSIPDAVEVAYDGYCIDGQFPDKGILGLEVKNKGYVGSFKDYASMPKQVKFTNEKLSKTFKDYQYRNFFSGELRIVKNGTPYMVDPCCRFGSPPSESMIYAVTNLAEIMWYGAEGKCVDPIPKGRYVAELLLDSHWAEQNWMAVDFPKDIRDNVKLRNLTVYKGRYYSVPVATGVPTFGAVVAVGNTLQQAIDKVREYDKEVEGYGIESYASSLDVAQEEIEKLNSFGIQF